jgi:hypothetical protein
VNYPEHGEGLAGYDIPFLYHEYGVKCHTVGLCPLIFSLSSCSPQELHILAIEEFDLKLSNAFSLHHALTWK